MVINMGKKATIPKEDIIVPTKVKRVDMVTKENMEVRLQKVKVMEDMAITITIMAMVGVFLQNLWKHKPQPMDRKSDHRNMEDHIRRNIIEKAVKSFLNMMMIIMFLLKMT